MHTRTQSYVENWPVRPCDVTQRPVLLHPGAYPRLEYRVSRYQSSLANSLYHLISRKFVSHTSVDHARTPIAVFHGLDHRFGRDLRGASTGDRSVRISARSVVKFFFFFFFSLKSFKIFVLSRRALSSTRTTRNATRRDGTASRIASFARASPCIDVPPVSRFVKGYT